MRTLKNVTFLYPLLGYLTPLSFETIGNCMLYTQMVGLAINIMFQMFAPVLALIGFCRSVVMPFAAEMGKMGDFMEMVADAKGDSKLSIPKVPQLSTEQAQAILNHAPPFCPLTMRRVESPQRGAHVVTAFGGQILQRALVAP